MTETATKSKTAAKNKNKVVLLKEQIAEALDHTTHEFAGILNSAVSYVEGLDHHEIRAIVLNKAIRPSLKVLGLQVIDTTASTPEPVKTKAKRSRKNRVSDDDIVVFLKTERSVGQVRTELGQLVPKRLAGLEKTGKLVMREDGLKKLWKAK